jgi:hypothetical protein
MICRAQVDWPSEGGPGKLPELLAHRPFLPSPACSITYCHTVLIHDILLIPDVSSVHNALLFILDALIIPNVLVIAVM